MKNKNIARTGEFGLIEMIKNKYSVMKGKNIIAGNGDDCFCFRSGKETICITKDMLIENVHFKKEWTSPQILGEKAIEVNISDIASMGSVQPKYVFIGLGIPPQISQNYINDLYKGFKKACERYYAVIAGGDTVRSDKIVISITVVGKSTSKIITRKGAKKGDLIGITNTFGDAGAGIDLLFKYGNKRKYTKEENFLISKQNAPKARLKEASKIAKYLTSMTDASDGLFVSIGLVAENLGAEIDLQKIPISKELKKVIPDKEKQIKYALFGAEDFELVFTVPKNKAASVKKILPEITYIGIVTAGKKVKYFNNGKEEKFKYCGYKHF